MMRWDIFCRVIDNYGDIGVCWRLARQLAAEHGLQVRLWLDDLASLQALCPEIDPSADTQSWRNIEIRRWTQPFPEVVPNEVVVEAFGCELPESYQQAMATPSPQPSPTRGEGAKPVWINLEYLSAESWVDRHHGLPSPHPRLPLVKYFFFPGFTPATGGLLRERDLLPQRDMWQRNPAALWQALNLPHPASNETTVSLFSYDSAPVAGLLDAWAASAAPVRCLLPEGKVLARVAAHFGKLTLAPGDMVQRGSLTLRALPFLRQEDYDLLLWACDCNFVRGEDSFVRAQWAARPLVWQIYRQQEDAHLAKLDAFLDRYCVGLDGAATASSRAFHHGWNGNGKLDWEDFWRHRAALQVHAAAWSECLAAEADLASKLVIFCKNRV